MNKTFRGDTFWRTFLIEYENEPYMFQEGDKIRSAFCDDSGKHLLKEITVEKSAETVKIEWSSEEMATLVSKRWILETEITTKKFRKTHQEVVDIFKDHIITEGAE